MPTYDYVCSECGHKFEHFQRMSSGALRKCPECGKLRLKRLMGTGAGVIFKGSGFYETDYKRKSGGNGSAGTRPSKPDSSESATDTKKTETTKPESRNSGEKETKAAAD